MSPGLQDSDSSLILLGIRPSLGIRNLCYRPSRNSLNYHSLIWFLRFYKIGRYVYLYTYIIRGYTIKKSISALASLGPWIECFL